MNLNRSTRYALFAAIELARAIPGRAVTATRVAEAYGIPPAVTAKVFQQLVRAGIAVGTRGTRGGYRLARPPSRITVLEVMEVFEPVAASHPASGEPDSLRRLLEEVDELVRATFASVTLSTLAGSLPAEGRARPEGT